MPIASSDKKREARDELQHQTADNRPKTQDPAERIVQVRANRIGREFVLYDYTDEQTGRVDRDLFCPKRNFVQQSYHDNVRFIKPQGSEQRVAGSG